MTTVAQLFPARRQPDGTVWYRSGKGQQDGWSSQVEHAHPSYLDDDAPPVIEVDSDPWITDAALDAAADILPTTTEEITAMPRATSRRRADALTDDFEPAARFTTWMRYPLPPETPRPVSDFNGWGWYKLPAPETGLPSAFPRATTISAVLDDTYGLNKWKRRETARRVYQLATMDPATVVHTSQTGDDLTAADVLGILAEAMDAPKVTPFDDALDLLDNIGGGAHARELGECVHAWLEALDMGVVLARQVPEIVQPHIKHARAVLAHRGLVPVPEYVERTVLNDRGEETVAGTIDRIFRIVTTGELVLGDVKTSASLKYSWLSFGVQVGGVYGWATKVLSLDGKSWEPMPEIRDDFAVLLHVPSDQPERASAITINLWWGGEVMAESLATRRRRKEAPVEVPKFALPVPSPEAIRYAEARNALSEISSHQDGQAVYDTYQDVWDDDLDAFAMQVAELL